MDDTYHKVLELAERAGLPLILIGGHAVNALGYERTTLDIDFLVLVDDLPRWKTTLLAAGFSVTREIPNFAQFAPADVTGLRLDLMSVDQSTFSKIESASQVLQYGHRDIRVPSVLHLIALKLHALKNPAREELGKDYGDILALIRRHGVDTFSADFQTVLERYATPAIRVKLLRDIH